MSNLIDNRLLTPEETNQLRWSYDCLQIPLPEDDEYYNGNTKITFINDAAITLRLEQTRKVNLVRHPHVTRPVGSIALSKKWRLDIVQGGETSVSPEEAARIQESISRDGFIVDDISGKDEERNCLRIPKKNRRLS